jgi:hypothetical protein
MPISEDTGHKRKSKQKKQSLPAPHLQIDNQNLDILIKTQAPYNLARKESINTRSIYNMLANNPERSQIKEIANELAPSKNIDIIFKDVFLRQFNKYISLNYNERTNYLANVLFGKETVERNLNNYDDNTALTFLYEMALINKEANETAQALRHLEQILAICEKPEICTNFTVQQIEDKKIQAVLLLLKLQRSCKYINRIKTYVQLGNNYINRHPDKTDAKIHFFIDIGLLKLNDFTTSQRKEQQLLQLIEIAYYFKSAFTCLQERHQLSNIPLYNDHIYIEIINLSNALSSLLIHLLDYDYEEIVLEQRLLTCKAALNLLNFKKTVDQYINSNEGCKLLLNNKPLQNYSAAKRYIQNKITKLNNKVFATIAIRSSIGMETNNTLSQPIPVSATPQTSQSLIIESAAPIITSNHSRNPAETIIEQLNQAESYLITKNLLEANKIFTALLRLINTITDLTVKIRILLGNSDLKSAVALKNIKKLNLDKRFAEAEALTEEDLTIIESANKNIDIGIDFCNQASTLIHRLANADNGNLSLAQELTFIGLQNNTAKLNNKLNNYHKKMKALKVSLQASGKWQPTKEKSPTTIMLRKMLAQKKATKLLNRKLTNVKRLLFCDHEILNKSFDEPISATEQESASNKLVVGYLYPVKIEYYLTNIIKNTAIGYVYPVTVEYFSADEDFEFNCSNGTFYSLTRSYFPTYPWQGSGIAHALKIDGQFNPQKDIQTFTAPGFTTNPYLFFSTTVPIKTRRRSIGSLEEWSVPSIKQISDRTNLEQVPEKNENKVLAEATLKKH